MRRQLHDLARRAARTIPPTVREVGLALAARAIDGPALLPGPPPGPVLVVAPHPDDESIGAGGAIARHVDQGDEVLVVVATSGERTRGGTGVEDVAAAREAECVAACEALGLLHPPVFLRLPDGALGDHVEVLAERLRHHGATANVVYAPSVLDPHRDHRAANVGLARAGLAAEVLGYEVWSPAPVDVLLDIDAVIDRKLRALSRYATALETIDYVRTASGLAAYRSAAGGLGGAGHAEGFVRLPAGEHAALVQRAGLLHPTR
jgi:N-acetylglucosamine malate deacetylase 1